MNKSISVYCLLFSPYNMSYRWEIKGFLGGTRKKLTSFLLSLDPSKLIKKIQTGVKQLKRFSFKRVQKQEVSLLTDLSSAEPMFYIQRSFFSTFITDSLCQIKELQKWISMKFTTKYILCILETPAVAYF